MNLVLPVRLSTTVLSLALVLSLGVRTVSAQDEEKTKKLVLRDGVVNLESKLTEDDPKDKVRKHPCKIFTVEFKDAHTYQIDMVSDDVDSYLRLEDPSGKQVASDDDGGGFPHARIVYKTKKAGNYRIISTTFGGGTGAFTLTVKESGGKVAARELKLKEGTVQIDGELAATDPKDTVRKNCVCKIYTIKFVKGKTYQIDMESKKIDSYLRLEDATGKQLASDDDSGGFPNARIVFECPEDGTYRIITTTFNRDTGPYTLIVTEK